MIQHIRIGRTKVEIEWGVGPGAGYASHTVTEADLDEETVIGPCDGQIFEIEGKKYELGEHEYETSDGGMVTCTAAIYELDED